MSNSRKENGESEDDVKPLKYKIFVGNISYRIDGKSLTEHFSNYGEVVNCYIVRDHIRRRPKGTAFITFKNEESVEKVLCLRSEQLVLDNREMRVARAEESERWKMNKSSSRDLEKQQNTEESANDHDIATAHTSERIISTSPDIETTDNIASPINRLNDDDLGFVLSLLPFKDRVRSERVCQRWRRVCRETWLRRRTLHFKGIFSGFKGLTDKILKSILSKGFHNLTNLDISASSRQLTEKALETIGHYCVDLEVLNIDGLSVTNKSMEIFAKRCNKLTWLSAQRCYIGENGLWWLLHKSRNLTYLNLTENPQISGQCFHMLGNALQVGILTDCGKLSDVGIHKIAERSPDLREIYLSRCWQISDASLHSLAEHSTKITVLHVPQKYISMTKAGLLEIARLTYLEELNISFNQLMCDGPLTILTDKCRLIQSLDISGCNNLTETGLCALADLHQLKFLNVSYILKFTDIPLQMLANNNSLTSLIARACVNVTDTALSYLAQNCSILTKLDISSCHNVTKETIVAFILYRDLDCDTRLYIIVGGTSIVLDQVDIPTWMHVDDSDLSQLALRFDRELILRPETDEEEFDSDESVAEGEVVAASFDDDHLINDDPLADDDFDLS